MSQWVVGFVQIVKEETNQDTRNYMLEYLADLINSHDIGWQREVMLSYAEWKIQKFHGTRQTRLIGQEGSMPRLLVSQTHSNNPQKGR